MKAIVCVDDKFGVAFNNRRQSRDRILIKKILELVDGKNLYLSPYSEKLFEESSQLKISENYLKEVPSEEFCFVEREELAGFEKKITELFLVKWNRVYPNDKTLKLNLKEYKLRNNFEFAGSSHEKITVEIYEKNK